MQPIDLTRVETYPISRRSNLVSLTDLIAPEEPAPPFANPDLDALVERIATARRAGRPVIWMMGAHVVKSGLSLILIDLMRRGLVTHVAGNGAVSIHDVELAMIGETSEDVPTGLEDGTFGMADETGRWMHQALQAGARDGLGYGAAIGRQLARDERAFPHRDVSVLYNAYRLGIPATIHVTLGADIIHQHPTADFAVLGAASGLDFRLFASAVADLADGVFLNFGSAVTGPEVFLKALTVARNLGYPAAPLTTANFDLLPLGDYRVPLGKDQPHYYYRPRKNIVNRPTASGGQGYHITGDHRVTIPNLHHRLIALIESAALRPGAAEPAPLPVPVQAVLDSLATEQPELACVLPALQQAYRILVQGLRAGGTLFLCGNGGSMADALHISGELLKRFAHPRPLPSHFAARLSGQPDGDLLATNLQSGLRAVVLGANAALASAVANDMPDRDMGLAQELLALARPGDVLLALSTSGNARNVAYAAQTAHALGLPVLGMTARSGGKLAELADVTLRAPAQRTEHAQVFHIRIYHALCEMLELAFFPEP